MPINKEQKRTILHDLTEKISKSKSIVFTKFDKLTVKENEELRNQLKAENSEYCVAKKTLINLALKNSGFDVDAKHFEGKIAAIFGYQDEVAPAKIVNLFKKTCGDKIEFVGGILENKFITPTQVTFLAKLPSKQELYAQIVGSINAPISGFVNVLAGNLRNFVGVLNAIKESKVC